jgi:hypothetical protein
VVARRSLGSDKRLCFEAMTDLHAAKRISVQELERMNSVEPITEALAVPELIERVVWVFSVCLLVVELVAAGDV